MQRARLAQIQDTRPDLHGVQWMGIHMLRHLLAGMDGPQRATWNLLLTRQLMTAKLAHEKGLIDIDVCWLCGQEAQDWEHLVRRCPAMQPHREALRIRRPKTPEDADMDALGRAVMARKSMMPPDP